MSEPIWRKIKYLKISEEGPEENHKWLYELWLPEPLASWDVFGAWERERTLHMRDNLKKGDILFDIGAEHGWLSVVLAKIVGPKNMILIEPTKVFWPNIKATWEKNYPGVENWPEGFYDGLLSNKTTDGRNDTIWVEWPLAASGDLIDRNKYQYIHNNTENVPEITLDDYIDQTGVAIPDALNIDVEGAEMLVLKGAEKTLKKHKPKIWLSIHPDLMERDYNTIPEKLFNFMQGLGYKKTHLAIDHEIHEFWEAK